MQDTRAIVSLIDQKWKTEYLSNQDIRPLSGFQDYNLDVAEITADEVTYDRWVEVEVNLQGNDVYLRTVPGERLKLDRSVVGVDIIQVLIRSNASCSKVFFILTTILAGAMYVDGHGRGLS